MADYMQILNELASLAGIEDHAPVENKKALLVAMDLLPEKSIDDPSVLQQSLETLKDEKFAKSFVIMRENRQDSFEIMIPVNRGAEKNLTYTIKDENQSVIGKETVALDTLPVVLTPTGQPERRAIDGVIYEKRRIKKPEGIPFGYNALEYNVGSFANRYTVAYAPEKCYDPINIKGGGKTWGVPVQLYEQKSDEDQGMGDFSSLAELGNVVGRAGGGILGVNPLHAMFHDKAEEASPYAPASRTFFNFLYNDVTAVPDFNRSKEALELYDSKDYTKKRRKIQDMPDVDYTSVAELKMPILEKCYQAFVENEVKGNTPRAKAFNEFKAPGGCLYDFAVFQALSDHFAKQDPAPHDWRDWPKEYQDPSTAAVRKFAEKNKDRVDFYLYLQWETDRQLGNVQNVCRDSGMKVGLYTDIAVGSAPYGFEAWGCKDAYMRASAGAPADVLSPNGQKWDILGFKPHALEMEGYKKFIDMMRNNMKHAGCTRLDHVLQLQRLYMIPEGKTAKEGSFVYYPVDDLMALVSLESNRNKCMTIGEDLGQLPPGFQDKLMDHGILSYKVLPFEREWGYQHGGSNNAFRHPHEYPTYSVAAPSTHDTPSLASQWTARDVHLKDYLGYYESPRQRDLEFEQFATQREALSWAMTETGSWRNVGAPSPTNPRADTRSVPEKFEEATADYLGRANSAIVLFPFSDIFRTNYMGNIPGTRQRTESVSENASKMYEYGGASIIPWKNWRPKVHFKTNEVPYFEKFAAVANILNETRGSGGNDMSRSEQYQASSFIRPGRNEVDQRDPKRMEQLYTALANSNIFVKDAYSIIAAKFKDKRRQNDMAKTTDAREKYEAQRARIEEAKRQHEQKADKQKENLSLAAATVLKQKTADR